MKIVFMGTPDFAVPALRALLVEHEVVCVYTQPPRPAGRGQHLESSPVQKEAEKNGILVRTPVSLKSAEEQEMFQKLNADVAVVCAYGLILPRAILDSFPRGCINIHASLLPRWRGAAPIQRAIMAGDHQTGITLMQMDVGLDTGDILLSSSVDILPEMTTGVLHDMLSTLGGKLIVRVLKEKPHPIPQPKTGDTYAKKISKEECAIDWSLPANVVSAHIRGLSPYPKAYFMLGEERIYVLNAKEVPLADLKVMCGTVVDNSLTIACGQGTAISLTTLQRSGKRALSVKDFLRGFPIRSGVCLYATV